MKSDYYIVSSANIRKTYKFLDPLNSIQSALNLGKAYYDYSVYEAHQ